MEISVLSGPVCARCSDPLPEAGAGTGAALCRACRMVPPDFKRAVAYGPYEERMRAAIHALKYDRMHPAAWRMGAMLAQAVAKLAGEAPNQLLVVPVPLHRSKLVDRGFNKARVLAVHALRALRRSHPEWKLTLAPSTLMRLRATGSQAGLSPRQRRMNVQGAFQVANAAAVEGKHVLLVDGILTTGATARAASKTLKRAGAATVWVATLARAGRAELQGRRGLGSDLTADVVGGTAGAGEPRGRESARGSDF